ncbi:MAG: hypothetical protein AAGH15_07265, partial [Myxococcota bacterium]
MSNAVRRTALLAMALLLGVGCRDRTEAPEGGQANTGGERDRDAMAEGPIPLSPALCDDPSRMRELRRSLRGGDEAPGYGEVDPETVRRMLAAPTEGPFYMVNLIKYRERAVYPDGRATDLSGREANALYAPTEFLAAIGARVVFTAAVDEQIEGESPLWDDVAIVEYPCPLAFFAMSANPGFKDRLIHKQAGLETTLVLFTKLEPAPPGGAPEPSAGTHPYAAESPTSVAMHVMRFRDVARYDDGTNEPRRSGREAWEIHQASGVSASRGPGVHTTHTFAVQGTLIGDGREWDEVRLLRTLGRAGSPALANDATRQASERHR